MGTPRKLTATDLEEVLARAISGEAYTTIALDYGVTAEAIAYHARKARLSSRRIRKLSDEQISEVVHRFLDGATVAELAREFGVGHTTVKKHVMRVTKAPPGRPLRRSILKLPTDRSRLAYLAGIIDGEGCLGRAQLRNSFAWWVTVSNTSDALEAWLKEVGGLFYYPPQRPSFKMDGTYTKQQFQWKVLRAWDALRQLEAIRPYLVIKAARADKAIAELRLRFGDPPTSFGRAAGGGGDAGYG